MKGEYENSLLLDTLHDLENCYAIQMQLGNVVKLVAELKALLLPNTDNLP